jgi:hypothetical protein
MHLLGPAGGLKHGLGAFLFFWREPWAPIHPRIRIG